jgi:protein SCO1
MLAAGAFALHGANALAGVGDGLRLSERTQLVEPPAVLPDFSLTDQDGREFAAHDLRSQTALLFFGFSNCQGVCPATLQVLRQATREAGADATAQLRVVFISVDGERDTPAALKAYLEPFGPAFMGLTGAPAEVGRVARDYKAVFFKGMPRPAGGYDVEHTSLVYLVDRQGRLRATFQGAGSEEIASLTRAVMQETE